MNEEIFRLLDREELQLASKQKRFGAYMIDELILSVIWLSIIWGSFSGLESIEEKVLLINSYLFEFMALKVIYHTFFVTQYAASPGKIIMKIRILELHTASNPSFLCSLNRASVRVLSELIFYAGFVWGLLDPARQTWHDKTARTVVVDA
jgi:uncharacterized RDD family membrane protein YckC